MPERLVPDRCRWWHLFRRYMDARWVRRHGRCDHPHPTYGDERMHYGLRCGVCFTPCHYEENVDA